MNQLCNTIGGPGTVGGRAHLGLHCEEVISGTGRGGEAPGDTPLGHGNGRVMPDRTRDIPCAHAPSHIHPTTFAVRAKQWRLQPESAPQGGG